MPPASIKSRIDMSIPSEGCINDYYYIFKQKGTWKLWSDLVRRQEPEITQHGVQVATIDSARYSYLVEMHIKVKNTHYYKIMSMFANRICHKNG